MRGHNRIRQVQFSDVNSTIRRRRSELVEHKRILSTIVDLVKREASRIENALLQSVPICTRGVEFAREETELRLIRNVESLFDRIKESIELRRSIQIDEWKEWLEDNDSNSVVFGTFVAFNPVTATDKMVQNGITKIVPTQYCCITCMEEYQSKSLEELRFEDYSVGRKGDRKGRTPALGAIRRIPTFRYASSNNICSTGFNRTSGFERNRQLLNTASFSTNRFGVPPGTVNSLSLAQTHCKSSSFTNSRMEPFGSISQPSLFPFGDRSRTPNNLTNRITTQALTAGKNVSSKITQKGEPRFGVSSTTPIFSFGLEQQIASSESTLSGPKNAGTSVGSVSGNHSKDSPFQGGSTVGAIQNSLSTGFNDPFRKSPAQSSTSTCDKTPAACTAFGFADFNLNSATLGTTVAFNPISGTDTMVKNDVTQPVSTRHLCITGMKEYECKSLEELRLEDYSIHSKVIRAVATGFTKTQEFGTAHQLPGTGFFSKSANANGFEGPSTTSNTFDLAQRTCSTHKNSQREPFGPLPQPWPLPLGNGSQTSNNLFRNVTTSTLGFGKNSNSDQSNQDEPRFGVSSTTSTFNFGHGQTTAVSECTLKASEDAGTGVDTFFGSYFEDSPFQGSSAVFGTTQNSTLTDFNDPFKSPAQHSTSTFGSIPATPTAFDAPNQEACSIDPSQAGSNSTEETRANVVVKSETADFEQSVTSSLNELTLVEDGSTESE